MWTLGNFVVMAHDELEQRNNDARALGYRAGLKSKWRLKKKGEIESLLAAVDPGVVIPQRKADLNDFISRNAETYAQAPVTYGDSLPIVEDAELIAEIKARFDAREAEE